MPAKIFISYRREDSAPSAGRVYDRLVGRFGKDAVFKDVDSIPYGADFRGYINGVLEQCAAQVVLIGPGWAGAADQQGGSRLANPADFVRIEVETALQRGIAVIPVLVQGATMPSAELLPPPLAPLAYRNAVHIRNDPDFDGDVQRLIATIEGAIPGLPKRAVNVLAPRVARAVAWRNAWVTVLVTMIPIAIVGFTYSQFSKGTNFELVLFANVFGLLCFLLVLAGASTAGYRTAWQSARVGAGTQAGAICGALMAAIATVLTYIFNTIILTRNFGDVAHIQYWGPLGGLFILVPIVGIIGLLFGMLLGWLGGMIGRRRLVAG